MLSIKDVYKTYHPKKGVPVKALVNVSVDFQEKGLVFILGKSGSGKSTMLNIIGGLDKADQGEIIIKGKSSLKFKGSDFDNYRNTFVGFVFQEYNLLNDFNIGKNIALALELQGKVADKTSVEQILSKVDLTGYENRKVNELSGGQKQRVAIARALIKQPEIILADEPTGALDSMTGHQVFDILKKLGEEKLVIVVSHDRETAEEYANRIIEMKDGQIISDTSKVIVSSKEVIPGVMVNKNMIHFSDDHQFSPQDLELLQDLRKHNQSVVITSDANQLSTFTFNQTDAQKLNLTSYDGNKLKFVSSKLKNIDSFKIGASGLKYKKVRLFFTILLSFVAVSFFALTDTLSAFNVNESHARTLQSNNINSVSLTQYYNNTDEYSFYTNPPINFSQEQIEDIQDNFDDASIIPSVSESLYYNFDYETINSLSGNNRILYGVYSSFKHNKLFIDDNYLESQGTNLIAGHFPTNDNEFLVTSFQLELFTRFSFPYYLFDEFDNPTSYYIKPDQFSIDEVTNANLILNKSVDYNNENCQICGVINVDYDDDYLSETFLENVEDDYTAETELVNYVNYHNLTTDFVRKMALDELKISREGYADEIYSPMAGVITYYDGELYGFNSVSYFIKESNLYNDQLIKFNDNSLENDEIILSISALINIHSYQNIIELNQDPVTYQTILTINFSETEELSFDTINELITWDQNSANHQRLVTLFSTQDEIEISNQTTGLDKRSKYKLGGLYFATDQFITDEYNETTYYFSNDASTMTLNDYNSDDFGLSLINSLVFIADEGTNLYNQYMKVYHYKGQYSLLINSPFSSTFNVFGSLVEGLQITFLVLGSILAVFSALLMMNFIATSISYKRHDIGILRGLGARQIDVVKIFSFESLIIATINVILAIVATIPIIYFINQQIADALDMNIVLLNFTFRQFGLIVLIAVFSALIASIIPVLNIAHKKPIDAISGH